MTHKRNEFISTRQRAMAGAGAGFSRNQNLVSFGDRVKLGPVANAVIIILLVAFLGLLYLTQLTKTSTFGYQLNSIDNQRTQLQAEQNDLQVENARLQSLATVSNSTVAASMTTPVDVTTAQ
jgi:hypothetical protein